MKRSRHLIICLGISLGLAACGLDPNAPVDPNASTTQTSQTGQTGNTDPTGDSGGNNAQACQNLEDELAACLPSLAGTFGCSAYESYPCDLSDYWNCVADAYGQCSGGTFPDLDAQAAADCAALAQCT